MVRYVETDYDAGNQKLNFINVDFTGKCLVPNQHPFFILEFNHLFLILAALVYQVKLPTAWTVQAGLTGLRLTTNYPYISDQWQARETKLNERIHGILWGHVTQFGSRRYKKIVEWGFWERNGQKRSYLLSLYSIHCLHTWGSELSIVRMRLADTEAAIQLTSHFCTCTCTYESEDSSLFTVPLSIRFSGCIRGIGISFEC